MQYAPIVLFVYKRLDHVEKVVNALQANPEAKFSNLIVYSDAARNKEDEHGVTAVREYVSNLAGFADVHVVMRDKNWGIERNEIEGITETFQSYDRAIILEDDIMVGPHFLSFMNTALEKYEGEEKVFSITGYSFINEENITNREKECAFIQLTSAWGWATWKNRWACFQRSISASELLELCKQKNRERFNHGFSYADMVMNQYMKGYFTWDILWYWSSYRNGGLTLAPVCSMVNNIGMDGSGVHYTDKKGKNRVEFLENRAISIYPDRIEEDLEVRCMIEVELQKLASGKSNNIFFRLLRKTKKNLRWKRMCFHLNRKILTEEQE